MNYLGTWIGIVIGTTAYRALSPDGSMSALEQLSGIYFAGVALAYHALIQWLDKKLS